MSSNPGHLAGAAVDRFFERVLSDPRLAPRFEGAELHRLAAQQSAFVAHALGSSLQPGAAPISAGPGTDSLLAEHLAGALRDVGAPEDAVATVARAALHPDSAVGAYAPPVAGPPRRPSVPEPTGSSPAASEVFSAA